MPSLALPNQSLLESFLLRLKKRRAPNTVAAYGKVARAFLLRSPDGVPDSRSVEDFIAVSETGCIYAIPSRNHRLAALRALAKHALVEGHWSQDPTANLEFVKAPPRDPPVLSFGEVHRMFDALEKLCSPRQLAQHRAVLALLFTLGLRVHELVGLNVDQVDVLSKMLVSVRGKGGTVHDLPLGLSPLGILEQWLAERSLHAKPGETALFVSSRGSRMSARWVQRLFQKLRAATGTQKKITPHTARHSAATLALMAGADVSSIGELLRHSDLNVTRGYIRLVDVRKRQVTELLSNVIPVSLRAPEPDEPPPNVGNLAGGAPLFRTQDSGRGAWPYAPTCAPAFTPWSLAEPAGRPNIGNVVTIFPLVGKAYFPDIEHWENPLPG